VAEGDTPATTADVEGVALIAPKSEPEPEPTEPLLDPKSELFSLPSLYPLSLLPSIPSLLLSLLETEEAAGDEEAATEAAGDSATEAAGDSATEAAGDSATEAAGDVVIEGDGSELPGMTTKDVVGETDIDDDAMGLGTVLADIDGAGGDTDGDEDNATEDADGLEEPTGETSGDNEPLAVAVKLAGGTDVALGEGETAADGDADSVTFTASNSRPCWSTSSTLKVSSNNPSWNDFCQTTRRASPAATPQRSFNTLSPSAEHIIVSKREFTSLSRGVEVHSGNCKLTVNET
jgi:hypothetical protein